MKIQLPENARVIILEGIAGSGKTTYKRYLRRALKDRMYYEYSEGELLQSWKHIHIPGLSPVRMDYFERVLDQLEKKLKADEDALFILERFHLSMKILEWEFEKTFQQRYEKLLARIKKLPVHIIIAKVEMWEVRERMLHRERSSKQWMEFVNEKLKLRGYEDLEALSIEQQEKFFSLAEEQGIPYSAIHVELDW